MKKTVLCALACSAVLLGLISCNQTPDTTKEHVAEVVDLRNKKNGEAVNLRSAMREASGQAFSSEFLASVPRFIGENETKEAKSIWAIGNESVNTSDAKFDKIKAAVKIEDDKDGIKFTFTRPEGYTDKEFTWVNIQYLDEVGHKSTGMSLDKNSHSAILSKDTVSIVYPLVDDTKKTDTRFWIQLCTDSYEAQLFYKVVPAKDHGHGCVKAVQEDYKIRDYLTLSEDAVMTVNNTIPPVAKTGTLKHNIGVYAQATGDNQYTDKAGIPVNIPEMGLFEVASEAEISAGNNGTVVDYKYDFKDRYNKLSAEDKAKVDAVLKDKPYIWVSYAYKYQVNVEGLSDYTFDTPWVISNVIKNPLAK